MEYNTIFWIIITILVFDFVFERWLDFLNAKQMKPELPVELAGIYDKVQYAKQQRYGKEKSRFSLWAASLSFVLTAAMLFAGGFGVVDRWVHQLSDSPIWQALAFFGIIGLASDIIGTPFSIYSTFVIEEKFGFNKTTPKTFIMDKVKAWLLAGIIGGGLLALVVFIYMKTGSYFWIITLLLVSGFSIFMSMFYTTLLLPLFNKQTPLEDGELRSEIEAYGKKNGFKINNIYVMDGSKRSSKANAFFSGLGPKKRIVLYDTLVQDLSVTEVVSVLAHEVGHYKKKHTLQGMLLSVLSMAVMLFILSKFLGNVELAKALGSNLSSFHLSIVAFGLLYSPISFIMGIGMNVISRKNEYEADNFAKETHDATALIEGLKKLSVKSLSNLTPHSLVVFFEYSHPTLLQRMKNLLAA